MKKLDGAQKCSILWPQYLGSNEEGGRIRGPPGSSSALTLSSHWRSKLDCLHDGGTHLTQWCLSSSFKLLKMKPL